MARRTPRKTADTSSSTASAAVGAVAKGAGRKGPATNKRKRESSGKDGGDNNVKKRDWRKYQKICSADGCTKQAITGFEVCMKHGATYTKKRCSKKGCSNQVIKGGVCVRHGAKVKQCSEEGCTKQAQNGYGVCVQHGAKVKLCSSEGCPNQARNGGVCMKHGAKVKRCSIEECTNFAQNGGVCVKHGAKVKQYKYLCSNEGCKNKAKRGGKCWTHGGKPPKCSNPECQNYADSKGVCVRHGARIKECKSEGCSYLAWRGGFCYRHREDRLTATEVITEGVEVSVPALPPIDLPAPQEGPSEDAELESIEDCGICYKAYNIDDLVKCGSDTSCAKSICHDCLIRNFLCPSKLDGGQLTNYDPTKCPYCLTKGAFSLDETDGAIVEREVATMYSESGMYAFEQATVGASYASTSHEQGDLSDWEPNSGEEYDDE
jgi:hypothetical protein